MDKGKKRVMVRFEELAFSNMMILNALVELLDEKGLVSKPEILERVKSIRDKGNDPASTQG